MKHGKYNSIRNRVYLMLNRGLSNNEAILVVECETADEATTLSRTLNQVVETYFKSKAISKENAS